MIRVAVSGAAGRMGRLVADAVTSAADTELVACFDPGHVGSPSGGLAVTDDPTDVGSADVVVEFTNPDVVMANLKMWREMDVHTVVGTSGFDSGRIDELRALWGEGPPNCLVAPNFSIGAVLMMRFAAESAPHFSAAEIVELHHDAKADAPSGTAMATAAAMSGVAQQRAVESDELQPGVRGATVEGVPIHSVRLPGLVAHQQVILGRSGETLTIRHDTSDRAAFLGGVMLAVRRIATLAGVTIGIESLLES